jgi:acylphosphatase
MAVIARTVRVYGRVQGVFYRQWTVDQARRLRIAGWVRNRPDGSVEARLQGEEEAVAQLSEAMRHGPSQARVDDLTVEDAESEELEEFSVKL